MKSIVRRLRGLLGNAFTWAAAWFGASAFLWLVARLLGVSELSSWTSMLQFATEMGALGFVMGGAFSAYLIRRYRDRRIEDLNVAGFTLGAGLVTGLMSVVVIGLITWSQGWGWAAFRLDKLFVPIILPAVVLGGVTGYGSLMMARRGLLETSPPRGVLETGSVGRANLTTPNSPGGTEN